MGESTAGKVAFVTGASGILGPGICLALRREGYRVACCVRSAQKLAKTVDAYFKLTGERFDSDGVFIADLQDLDRCATVIAEAQAKLGPIHLLVNNAVTNEDPIKLKDLTPQYIRLMADVDLHAPLMLAKAALPDLAATQGSIVNISSVAVRWNWPGSLMYGSMKAALEHATECLAAELAPQNIRVNCIRLGSVPGDMSLRHAIAQLTPEQARQMVEDVIPVFERSQNMSAQPVTGRPRDVGELIVFLASPRARFLTGAVIPLDGGLVVQMEAKSHRIYMSDLVRQWTRQHAPHVKTDEPH